MRKKRQDKNYFVAGLGTFGSALCSTLLDSGAGVIAMDKDMARVEEFSDRVEYIACADCTNEAALEKIGVKDADVAVVCLGADRQAALLTAMVLLDMKVPYIIVCAADAMQARILQRIGVHKVINPQEAMGVRTANLLVRPWESFFADFADGEHMAGHILAPESILGRPLRELDLQTTYGMTIVLVLRKDAYVLPHGDLVLEQGDDILVFGDKQRMAPLLGLDT